MFLSHLVGKFSVAFHAQSSAVLRMKAGTTVECSLFGEEATPTKASFLNNEP